MSFSISQILVVMVGGALGAVARFMLTEKLTEKLGASFPYGTLSVNLIGSFLMGLLAIIVIERMSLDPLLRLGIFVGFLGAFTTFSTFSMDAFNLYEQGQFLRATAYIFSSVILSILALCLGILVGKAIT